MKAAEVWTLLLGAAVALIGTLIAQWSSLAYQTRRQRETRRADFQRTSLLQVRDLLGEVVEAKQRVTGIQYRHLGLADEWDPVSTIHPDAQALSGLTFRLRLAAIGLDNDELRGRLASVERLAWLATSAPTEDEEKDASKKLITARNQALDLLGEQLRKLP
jgi:hypothetical protein